MKNKTLLWLTLIAVIATIPAAVACARTSEAGDGQFLMMPHEDSFLFQNCNACHVSDQPKDEKYPAEHPFNHANFTNADCIKPGCHALAVPATSTTPPATTTTTTQPTTQPTTTPGGTTTEPGTTTPTTTAPGNPPIPTDGIDNITHTAAVYASYKGLCLMCHGAGAGISQYPLPPTYTSRSLSPGTVYSVAPGSPGDHTTRTDAAVGCEGEGCHKAP